MSPMRFILFFCAPLLCLAGLSAVHAADSYGIELKRFDFEIETLTLEKINAELKKKDYAKKFTGKYKWPYPVLCSRWNPHHTVSSAASSIAPSGNSTLSS